MSIPGPEVIPEDPGVWSVVLTEDFVVGLLQESPPSDSSPFLRRLYDVIVQRPSNPFSSPPYQSSVGQQASANQRTCVRNGRDAPLESRKRKAAIGTGDGSKPKKNRDWETDGVGPHPISEGSMLLSTMGSATSRARIKNLVNLVQALITHKTESVAEDDYRFEAILKMCDIQARRGALGDFQRMIGYVRLAFHIDQ